MSDSDGSPQRDDRHHRQSSSRSPVSPGCAGETPAEREERHLEDDRGTGWVAGPRSHRRPPATTSRWPQTRCQQGRLPPPPTSLLLPPRPREGPRMHKGPRPPLLPATPPPPAQSRHGGRAPRGALPETATAAAESRESAKYRAHIKPSQTHTVPRKANPPKAACPKGGPRPVSPPTPKRTPPGINLPQLRGGRPRGARGEEPTAAAGGWQAPGEGPGAGSSARGLIQGKVQGAAATRGSRGTGGAPVPAASNEGRRTGQARARAAEGQTQHTARGPGRETAQAAAAEGRRTGQARARAAEEGSQGTAWGLGWVPQRAPAALGKARVRETEEWTRHTGKEGGRRERTSAKSQWWREGPGAGTGGMT